MINLKVFWLNETLIVLNVFIIYFYYLSNIFLFHHISALRKYIETFNIFIDVNTTYSLENIFYSLYSMVYHNDSLYSFLLYYFGFHKTANYKIGDFLSMMK